MLDGPARASRHAGEDHPRSFRVARIERASACRRFLARSACAGRLTNMFAPRLSVEQRSSERSDHLPVGQIKAHFHLAASPPGPESAATAVRAETIFRRPIKLIWPVQSRRQKYSAFPKSNSVLLSRHLPLAGGAVRRRHGRGAGGAVDAMAAQRIFAPTNADVAYGQVAWSWHPDADAPTVARPKRVVVHGDQNARRTGERAKQPLRSSRGECRLPG